MCPPAHVVEPCVLTMNPLLLSFTGNSDELKSDQLLGVTMESRNGQFAVSRLGLSVLFKYCQRSQAISHMHVQPIACA